LVSKNQDFFGSFDRSREPEKVEISKPKKVEIFEPKKGEILKPNFLPPAFVKDVDCIKSILHEAV
jgi:hypothetical protein